MKIDENTTPLLTVDHLKQYFKVSGSFTVKAVEDVSFKIYPGETYGLVGESGSGKSTIGRSIIRLYDPTAGEIRFNGLDISGKMSKADSQTLRTQMQMIFQDPMASLNPRKKVEDIIGEGLDIHHKCKNKEERDEMVKAILAKVGLAPEHATRYPHQFSGVDDVEVYKEKVKRWSSNYESGSYFHWVIEWKETGELVGIINLGNVEESCMMSDTCYMLSPRFWNQGIMTEVLMAVLDYAFEEIGLNRVQAEVFAGNNASSAVLKKCGMSFEGIARQKYYKNGEFIDTALWAIIASDRMR